MAAGKVVLVYLTDVRTLESGTLQCERMDIATDSSALKAATELARSLRDGLKSGAIKGDEISGRIGEIYDHIVDSKDALVEARDEIQQLKDQLNELNRLWDFGKDLKSEFGAYWREDFQYCPSCWEQERKLTRLGGPVPDPMTMSRQSWTCPVHKATYHISRKK